MRRLHAVALCMQAGMRGTVHGKGSLTPASLKAAMQSVAERTHPCFMRACCACCACLIPAAPMLEKDAAEPPPFVVLVQGPPGVSQRSHHATCLQQGPASHAAPHGVICHEPHGTARMHVPRVNYGGGSAVVCCKVGMHSIVTACLPGLGATRVQVGKSTLIRCLVKHYARQALGQVLGPITVVAGKKRRVTFVECPSDLCGERACRRCLRKPVKILTSSPDSLTAPASHSHRGPARVCAYAGMLTCSRCPHARMACALAWSWHDWRCPVS